MELLVMYENVNQWSLIVHTSFYDAEYCERYAKKENIVGSPKDESDEEISEEDFSGQSDSDDEVVGHADPWVE